MQIGLRGKVVGAPRSKTRFGLGDVGARHLSDNETIAGLTQLLFKNNDVVFAQIEDRGIAQNIHIGGRAIEEDVLLRVAQALARTKNIRFRLPHAVHRAVAVEKILGDGQIEAPRVRCLS
ncbi:MAG: hypothetical protein USCAAHI_00629 [Beijerinckiaceae bacterium]|nr:MAG: hypothetical protein USCAAHI_00629 [Beijerinckiaceae bacterium]